MAQIKQCTIGLTLILATSFTGNEINKILKNLGKLDQILDVKYKPFVQTLQSLKELDEGVSSMKLDQNYEKLIESFKLNWLNLNCQFNVPVTNKCHIIMTHLKEYIELTGKSLGHTTDQTIEATHQLLHKRLSTSKYLRKDINNPKFADLFHRGICHFNSFQFIAKNSSSN